jgi:hypothetical protein
MKTNLSTTLMEMNRLYGRYTDALVHFPKEAPRAWIDYEVYARRYQAERGLDVNLEPRSTPRME